MKSRLNDFLLILSIVYIPYIFTPLLIRIYSEKLFLELSYLCYDTLWGLIITYILAFASLILWLKCLIHWKQSTKNNMMIFLILFFLNVLYAPIYYLHKSKYFDHKKP